MVTSDDMGGQEEEEEKGAFTVKPSDGGMITVEEARKRGKNGR